MEPETEAAVALARAVLLRAFKDAQRGDKDAVAWLWSEDAALMIDATGGDSEQIGAAIERVLDMPGLRQGRKEARTKLEG